ncbi:MULTISPECIES: GNAT family N-acetyltransferase [unclassified Diaminobutyricimonas]|uniref:GNAT family N-acetyltransferase n=1 Tax=unclassified Diaminobutyricimonas TaxID=2643261 RepID=UPI0012F4E723|nr:MULTISPECIES: GNAT family N-acetyltransferase [unclassified Diaminobutyricimonas]
MTTDAAVRTVPVDEVPWDDVRTVFGTRGDPARCWCQWFKLPNAQFDSMPKEEASRMLHDQVLRGPAPGVIAYLDDEPVGWCAVEPRPQYSRLLRTQVASASSEPAEDESVWAVTCFVVRVGFRRRGIGRALLHAAVDRARAKGARLLEAYPVDTAERQGASSASLYVGTVSLFAAEGFVEVARPKSYRVLMALEL